MNIAPIRIVMEDIYAIEDAVNDAVDVLRKPSAEERTLIKGELKLHLERWFLGRKTIVLEYDPACDTMRVVEAGR
jgi:hypothetical protein